ncbi:MAG: Asp-tRNA(Asn)/Glu-tRNA(Gln) amidotransferase subunit GatB [Cyclobacteriaceae bacterium]
MDSAIRDKYQPVIGLEVHAQLLTSSKIYSSDSTAFGAEANSQVGVITLAHPGTLPKLNKQVVEHAIKMGLACHSDISRYQIFDRKNYFYPDLPKGYQLTQDRTPICVGGYVMVSTKEEKDIKVKLNRIHIEEDAGKSIHVDDQPYTWVDLNRAGVPLIEIVTEPVIRSAEEAGALLAEIRKIVRYLEICDGNMEEGSLRCDANISVMLKGATTLGKKVEVKNMNSIRNVQRAIEFEIERQITELEEGRTISSETRTFDMNTGKTNGMRTKEELNDYRYFPDPDLSPLIVSEEWLNEIKSSMPALPEELERRLIEQYQLPAYDAQVLTEDRGTVLYFEEVAKYCNSFKAISNWLMGPVKSYLNDNNLNIDQFSLKPEAMANMILLVESGKLSFTAASQKLFSAMINDPTAQPMELAASLDLLQDSDEDSISRIVEEVLSNFPAKVTEYKKGKKGLISMFMGEVMKRTKGKADPKLTNGVLIEKLKEI